MKDAKLRSKAYVSALAPICALLVGTPAQGAANNSITILYDALIRAPYELDYAALDHWLSEPASEVIRTAATRDSMEKEIVADVNAVRTDPAAYASVLSARRPLYRDRRIIAPPSGTQDQEVTVEVTQEGLPALEEAIAALGSTHHRRALQLSTRLCKAARDHLLEQGPRGTLGHESPDGRDPLTRVKAYIPDVAVVGEALSYGRRTAQDVVLHLIIDDGVPDRGHRKSLLDPRFDLIGVACGYHKIYGIMCVIDLAVRSEPTSIFISK